jgi:hypothetical protein
LLSDLRRRVARHAVRALERDAHRGRHRVLRAAQERSRLQGRGPRPSRARAPSGRATARAAARAPSGHATARRRRESAVGPRDATAHTTTALSRASQFKQNGGRSELIREMSGGTGERIKRYYSGWCQYVKLAKSFQAAFVMYAFDVLPMVDIALIDGAKESDNIVPVVVGEPVESLATMSAVGTVPHPNPCFTATTFSKEYFISTGNKEGVALPI